MGWRCDVVRCDGMQRIKQVKQRPRADLDGNARCEDVSSQARKCSNEAVQVRAAGASPDQGVSS